MKNYGNRLVLAVMAICACLLPLVTVQAVKSSSAVPVTSVLNDTGVVADGTNYRIQSDNVSTNYFNGLSSVSSILQEGSGDWVLDTSASTTRAVLIDLRAPVPGSTTSPPFSGLRFCRPGLSFNAVCS